MTLPSRVRTGLATAAAPALLSLASAGCTDPPTPADLAPTATSAPTGTPTPKPTPTLTPEAAIHAALSQLLPSYDDPPYPGAVIPIMEVWLRDPEFGRDLARSLWITNGIDRMENDAVYGLDLLYDRDPALARWLLAYASEELVQSRNTMFLRGLYAMLLDHGDKFERLIAQPWFADGLDAGEANRSPYSASMTVVLLRVVMNARSPSS